MNCLTVELDEVRLPNGRKFFEVEIETCQKDEHVIAINHIKEFAKSAKPSLKSKYERFIDALQLQQPL